LKPIKAVGFDLFNTLVTVDKNALKEAVESLLQSLQKRGLEPDQTRFVEDHRMAALRFIRETRKDGRETHNRFWIQAALEAQGILVSPDDPRIREGVEAYFSTFMGHVRMIPGTMDMLEAVGKRFRVGLLSNFTHTPAARAILNAMDLEPFFEVCVISGEIGYRKPHARAFKPLVSGLGVDSACMIYVGDDPESDITGALESGLQPVWTTYVRDRGLPFAQGYGEDDTAFQGKDIPRITDWADLMALLDGKTRPI